MPVPFPQHNMGNPARSAAATATPAVTGDLVLVARRSVGKVPRDSSFSGYLQSSDTETRQFSDTISLPSQFSDRIHRLRWEIFLI